MISRICLQKNEEKYRSLKYETADFWAEVWTSYPRIRNSVKTTRTQFLVTKIQMEG
jgi:hypothetical protein